MDLRQEIFCELRNEKATRNYCWKFNLYNKFRNELRIPILEKEFIQMMQALIKEGYFTERPGFGSKPDYVLTEKGFEHGYNE